MQFVDFIDYARTGTSVVFAWGVYEGGDNVAAATKKKQVAHEFNMDMSSIDAAYYALFISEVRELSDALLLLNHEEDGEPAYIQYRCTDSGADSVVFRQRGLEYSLLGTHFIDIRRVLSEFYL